MPDEVTSVFAPDVRERFWVYCALTDSDRPERLKAAREASPQVLCDVLKDGDRHGNVSLMLDRWAKILEGRIG